MPGIAVGTLVAGKYRLEREIGSGGMGIVFAARHVHLDQLVALKFLLSEAATPEILERFFREARAAAKVQSEHVARVMDIGELDNHTPYIVMEYLEGDDLENIVRTAGPLALHDAVRYLLQACEALAEVHAQGIVHRDIKPANLFVTSRADGSSIVKLLDFGISSSGGLVANDKQQRLTHTSAVIGSPRYMSPEQLRSSRDVDARTDVWALGVTLFELLGATSPFASGTMPEVCASILKDAPMSLASVRPEVPPELEAVIKKCLEKSADARWADVGELAVALRPFGPASTSAISAERIAGVLQQLRPATVPPVVGTVTGRARTGQGTTPQPGSDDSGRTSRNGRAALVPTEFLATEEPPELGPAGRPAMGSGRMKAVSPLPDAPPARPSRPPIATGTPVPTAPVPARTRTERTPMPNLRPPSLAGPAPVSRDTRQDNQTEAALEAHYVAQLGGTLVTIPHRLIDLAKMTTLSIDHRAGFLMSRMDGITTIEDLLDLSGMSRLETLRLVCELLDHRLIRVDASALRR